ncbi:MULTISPECIES: hypothetical protein [Cyanophyceae]|uniref:hypothetical protein n=1 Tax=Cyanophyceae TaxID=3028117 RepID=UPI001683F398|nr:hypothetical protein [Trichocoleus sp. FACHB-832]MBD1908868.1 hypothetical protein [Trichocoleus sp. FACHB-832]
MQPKFTDITSWGQAEILMQPAFIRIIDHIRKHLDQSTWKGTYKEVLIWSGGTSEETKAAFTALQQQLATASPEEASVIENSLADIPNPYPGYLLCLQQQDREVSVDLWELCYQVCFRNYNQVTHQENAEVEIDTSLIEEDTGDVDWNLLDAKAKHLVEEIFVNLPGT